MFIKDFTSHKKYEKLAFVTTYFFLHRGILVSNILENNMKNFQDDAKLCELKDKFQKEFQEASSLDFLACFEDEEWL